MHIFSPFLQFKYRRNGLKVNGSRHPDCWFIHLLRILHQEHVIRGEKDETPEHKYLCVVGRRWELREEHSSEWEQRPATGAPTVLPLRPPKPSFCCISSVGGWSNQRKNSIWGLGKIHDKFCLKSELVWRKDEARGSRWRWGQCWYKGATVTSERFRLWEAQISSLGKC